MIKEVNNIYTNPRELPRLTKYGFLKTKVPKDTWDFIMEMYALIQHIPPKEDVFDKLDSKYKNNSFAEVFSLEKYPNFLKRLFNDLLPIHEWWVGQPLIPTTFYGIRSYMTNSSMKNHLDWVNTHHVSSIITIDKDLGGKKDWPLHIQDHDGNWHKVYTEPGDMILYESATCEHGRPEVYEGKFFRNLFIHYALKEWTYLPIYE